MGVKPSLIYSVPVSQSTSPDESEIFRNPSNTTNFQYEISPNIETLQDLYIYSSKIHAQKLFLGSRSADGMYSFRTYEECFELVNALGEAILKLNLPTKTVDEYHDFELDVIGIFAKNREEWILTDLACMIHGIVTVPFFETVTPNMFSHILEQTNMTSIFCSNICLEFILNQSDLKNLETVICFDPLDKLTQAKIKQRGLDYCNFNDLLQFPISPVFKLPKIKPSNVYTISYTSGTGLEPRGVIISHRNIITALINGLNSELSLTTEDIYLSYLPLAHIFERYMVNFMMSSGCRVGIYNGEIMKLKSDIADLKPTIFASVPKMYNKLFNSMNDKISQLSGLSKYLFNKALHSKTSNYNSGNGEKSYIWDKLIFSSIQREFGSKFKWMLCAAAPMNPSVLLKLKLFCSCPIFEAYGLTESTGGTFLTLSSEIKPGAYATSFNVEYKIKSVNNMSYSVDYKDEKGVNRPRGELLVRGPNISPGYFKNQEDCQRNYEGNGWLKTGDIVELDRNDGSLYIIDRKKDLFKLAFGEYIAPGKIEKAYLNCKCIREILVHGESVEEYLIGIVVINKEWLSNDMEIEKNDLKAALTKKNIIDRVLSEMDNVAKEVNLFNYEKVRKIHLILESFESLGLLTPTFKLKRFEVKKYFAEAIKELYKH